MLSLDFLRLIAAVLVMIEHFFYTFDLPFPRVLDGGLAYSKACVTLFFVLSGYVLAGSLQKERPHFTGYAAFQTRRFFRIYPAYWAVLVLTFVLLTHLKSVPGFTGPGEQSMSPLYLADSGLHLKQWFIHATLILPGLENTFALPVVWTLIVEAYVSLIFPLIAWTMVNKRWAFFQVLLWAGSSVWLATHLAGSLALVGLFVIGASLHNLPTRLADRLTSVSAVLLLTLSLLLYYCQSLAWSGIPPLINTYLCGTGCAGIIWLAVHWHPLRSGMETAQKFVRRDVSYSLYLVHLPIFFLMRKHWLSGKLGASVWLLFGIVFLLAWLAALIVQRLIELPALSYGRTLSRSLWKKGADRTV